MSRIKGGKRKPLGGRSLRRGGSPGRRGSGRSGASRERRGVGHGGQGMGWQRVRNKAPATLLGLPDEVVGPPVACDQLSTPRRVKYLPLSLESCDQHLAPRNIKGHEGRGKVMKRPSGFVGPGQSRKNSLNGIGHGGRSTGGTEERRQASALTGSGQAHT